MANDKMTWAELRKAIALAANTGEQETGMFLDALMETITNGLKTDKQVRIKGLGTFSVKAVAPRRSVNIATGEAFVIDGYNKLTFSAESTLKESVEKRIERPNTEEMIKEMDDDPMRKLGEQADEIVDILADLGQSPHPTKEQPAPEEETPEDVEEEIEDEVEEETQEEEQEDQQEEPEQEEQPQAEQQPEEQEQPNNPTNITDMKTNDNERNNVPETSKKCHSWIGWLIAAILLLILLGVGFYFRETIRMWWQCMKDCQPTEVVDENIVEEPVEIVADSVPAVTPLAQQPREYTRFIGTERVNFGSRLAWISYKYYGVKDLWVFIYEANRDQISHPNHLQYGKKIRIPLLSEKLMDLSEPETRQLIDQLQKEYLAQ